MSFAFEIGADGQLAVIGTPVDAAAAWHYHREGPYRLDGDQLVTPALNEGLPVTVRSANSGLVIAVTDDLWLWLRRE
jgi:hypothetical protein